MHFRRKKKKIPSHALVSHSITGFSTLNQLVTDFASKRKTAFCHSSFCLYITITFRQVRSLANLSEYLNRALANRFWYCEKESELKPSFLSKDGQWTQAQKHLKAPERQLSVFISNVFPKDHDSHWPPKMSHFYLRVNFKDSVLLYFTELGKLINTAAY